MVASAGGMPGEFDRTRAARPPRDGVDPVRGAANSIPQLWDLMELPTTDARGASPDRLADWILERAEPGSDVRVLVPGGHRHLELFARLAEAMHCDVYLPAAGAELHEEGGEPVTRRSDTGEPLEWSLIRPSDIAPEAPSWFERGGGRVLRRRGVATIPMGMGVAFATRASFLDLVAFATATATAPPAVTPLAAVVYGGQFVIGWFDGREAALAGADFARLVAATVDELRPEVRLALTWPRSMEACLELDRELERLAQALDRVIWVPPWGGSAVAVSDLAEPIAVDADSHPAPWLRYDPDGSRGSSLFAAADGRLLSESDAISTTAVVLAAPAGEISAAATAFAGGSVPVAEGEGEEFEEAGALDELRHDHPALMRRADNAFRALDFARPDEARCLGDLITAWSAYLDGYGRLPDTGAGAAALHRVFALRRTLHRVFDACRTWEAAGARRAEPLQPEPPQPEPLQPEPVQLEPLESESTPPAPPPGAPPFAVSPWPPVLAEPEHRRAASARPAHYISWLPAHPLVNASDMELYVWSFAGPERLPLEGVTAPDVFLLGRANPIRLAARAETRFLLRMSVGAQRAVRLADYAAELPASIQHRAREATDIYLLPTSWLAGVTTLECYELDDAGEIVEVYSLSPSPLSVSFAGADHGVPGLPNAAVRWPQHRARASGYLVLPEDLDQAKAALADLPGWIPLHAKRPTADTGCVVYEIQVPRRSAVDVGRTRAMLSDMPVVPSSLAALDDHHLALPARAFKRATITKVHVPAGGAPVRGRIAGRSLHDVTAA
jgi:hypothetical protein